ERPLILIGTGSGIAPLHGILRDALRQGHTGPIHIYHGTRQPEDLYLDQSLHDLASRHDNVHYYPCVSQPDAPPSPDDA
ncbi:hypothetical protein Q6281_31615, partial [Klebsiella pneumoniae]|nr:hypothetical protein [Klebsiella pneumoniae]